MTTVMIASFKNKKDATLAARLLKKIKKSEVGFLNKQLVEDAVFAKLIDEGMKERGTVPLKKIEEKLMR